VSTLAKLINSNHSTIVNYIKNGTLFRGDWYLSNIPFNLTDKPLVSNWYSTNESNNGKGLYINEGTVAGCPAPSNNIILEMNNSSHIKKAVFVYSINKEFIRKFEGVTQASKELNINHCVIKKYALLNAAYKGYICNYERLID
jgi:hypothetical protein